MFVLSSSSLKPAISDDIVTATIAEAELPLSLTEQCCVYSPQDEFGATPLMAACWENHLEVVSFLIEKGADIHLQTKVSFTFVISTTC